MFEADRGLGQNRWEVVRLRAGSKTEVVLLSTSFFSVTTHFNRVTILCSVEGCALCDILPSRGLFYLAVMCMGRVHVLELGAQSAALFEQHAKLLHGGLVPGLVFELRRRGAKSPVHSEVVRTQEGVSEIDRLTLAQRVLAVYKYPPCNPGDSIEVYEKRVQTIAQRRNEFLARELEKRQSSGV